MEDCLIERPLAALAPPQGRAWHVVRATGPDARSLLRALTLALAGSDAEVKGLSLNAVGDRVEASLRLSRLGEAEVRLFGDVLAAAAGVRSVAVEHHLGRP
jgi:hypothetical protein